MTFDFINPLMLIGLTGLALPILAHLISKKKYDVVHWGAMQFLELGRNARRRLRLEELLLLLVRMGLVALLVIALARPWVAGGWLTRYVSKQDRDVVFVIDGSYSMGWQGEGKTPHEAAVQWARDFLEELKTGDTVALIDARDRPRAVIEFPTSDLDAVRAALDELPAPAGTANLPEAIAKAIQILARTSNLVREVIVLSDGQALSWRADDENLWLRIDDLRQQPAVLPRIWAVNVRGPTTDTPENFLVDRLQVSRELTVSGFPVRISTRVRRSGGTDSVMRTVSLEVDGQRLSEKTLTLRLPPDGAASVEFEYRFTSPGAHLVSVVMEADLLPGDDRADAAIRVAAALPALLVDGDPQPDPARMETFFAQAALTASVNDSPRIRATVLPWDQFDRDDLAGVEVVVLMNVPRLTDAQLGALKDFLNEGGGVCIALGDRIEARRYRTRILAPGDGLLPAELIDTVADTDDPLPGVYVSDSSLELPWLARFRQTAGGGFTEARFARWWKVRPVAPGGRPSAEADRANSDAGDQAPSDGRIDEASSKRSRSGGSSWSGATEKPDAAAGPATVEVRLDTGDPLLLTRRYGRGLVALWTSSLDADWNTLPAKPDYVPFLHELIFRLTSGKTHRNVVPGMPLIAAVPKDVSPDELVFVGPNKTTFPPEPAGDELRPLVQLSDTHLPGVYRLKRRAERAAERRSPAAARREGAEEPQGLEDCFVVQFDRSESDLRPLNDAERTALSRNSRMAFVQTQDELREEVFAEDSQTEIWHLLLWLFLVILVAEVVMTRRLVQTGHAVVDEQPAA
ncbi:MAG TPA: VWA domain-containing protein [Planctomycetaceae bacterium]|nr:VWA domain-containing protein [Planctomycetaceae bacterium]